MPCLNNLNNIKNLKMRNGVLVSAVIRMPSLLHCLFFPCSQWTTNNIYSEDKKSKKKYITVKKSH